MKALWIQSVERNAGCGWAMQIESATWCHGRVTRDDKPWQGGVQAVSPAESRRVGEAFLAGFLAEFVPSSLHCSASACEKRCLSFLNPIN